MAGCRRSARFVAILKFAVPVGLRPSACALSGPSFEVNFNEDLSVAHFWERLG